MLGLSLLFGPALSLLIRLELAEPGITILPDALIGSFHHLVTLHGQFSLVAVILVGLCLGAVARAEGHPAPRWFLVPGLVLCGAVLLVPVLIVIFPGASAPWLDRNFGTTFFDPRASEGEVTGWTLYPPLTHSGGLDLLALSLALSKVVTPILGLLAPLSVTLGASAWLTVPARRRGGMVVSWGAVLGTAAAVVALPSTPLQFGTITGTLGSVPLVSLAILVGGLLALRHPRWDLYLILGLLLVLSYGVFGLTVLHSVGPTVYHDTYYVVAHFHSGLGVLGIFVAFTALVAWLKPRVHWILYFCHAWLMTLSFLASYMPMLFLGRQGMPRRYIDYPDAFSLWNKISSIGAFGVAGCVVIGIAVIILRRERQVG